MLRWLMILFLACCSATPAIAAKPRAGDDGTRAREHSPANTTSTA